MSVQSAKDQPIKVLWLTSSYPRNKDDSASVFLRYLAEALASQKVNLYILAPDHPEVHATKQPDGIVCRHFRYFWPRKWQMLAYRSGILPNLRAAPWLLLQVPFFILSMFITAAWIVVVQRPSLIHAHWIFPQGTVAVLLGKLFKIPVLVTAHGGDAFALRGSVLGAIKRWTIKHCAAWTSNTEATADAVGPDLPKPQIIPMGIDYEKFAAGNAQAVLKPSNTQKIILLFVGRLVEKKGVADLIVAVADLPKNLLDRIELWIIGDGVERERLKMLAVDLKIEDKVVFYGRFPNAILPDYYAAADIFIAPSIVDSNGDTEGQGVILLEAMASGTAVISTRTGGVAEIIEHGKTGLLVDPKQTKSLSKAIEQLLVDETLRKGLCAFGRLAAEPYDWKEIASKFVAIYSRQS
ncbi:glycosyltransferase [Methylomonas sp. ZR1]|uniref:glycosyltransferase n=1 Tax=Methylomonas sp. ZR1 TaxID=1797072 RepID=UPI0014930B35|nr:glycosyltransferase [Methylomonas sp. ZR1]NOV29894.1 glycosyltransferase family 4 protein [Methylomonas sp. ZR1]